jgi:hypothetical protein
VRYSVEVKQYSSDLAIGLALVLLAVHAVSSRSPSAVWAWGSAGAVAIWFAHPAVFILCGTSAALVVGAVLTRDVERLRLIGRASALWVVSFAVAWWLVLRALGHDRFLLTYWKAGFAPRPLAPHSLAVWLARTPARLVHDPGSLPLPWVAAAVVAVGIAALARRRPVHTAVLVLPVLAAAGAAVVGSFPLLGRMALWTLPVIAVGAAAAIAVAGRARPWGAVLVALILVGPAVTFARAAHDPTTWSDVRPLLLAVRPLLHPGDVVWVHSADTPTATYYARSTGVALSATVEDDLAGGACSGIGDLRAAAALHRVWFVYGYHASTAPRDEEHDLDAVFASESHRLARVTRPQATATLWDFGAPPDTAATAPRLGCIGVTPVAVVPTGITGGPFGTGGPT